MIKNLSNLSGAQELSKTEQKKIVGAAIRRCCEYDYNANGVLVCTLWVSGTQQCP
ncbi:MULTISPECIES: hypothetical protein [Flavobacterium]|uniref:Uncharacterized protein n=1 Tax=Flavobacterium hankyongi TaxID=1176532 RepID=A0ABP8ZVX1_9FLAO|nr:hypothetical protein [Flavobacterium sp. N1846]